MISVRSALILAAILFLLTPMATAQPRVNAVLNAASFDPFVCPGAIVSIFGNELAPPDPPASSIPLPTDLGGVSVTVDGVAAPLYFVSPRQINAQIPFGITAAKIELVVHTADGDSVPFSLDLLPTAPGIFTASADGRGTPVLLSPTFDLLDTVRAGQRVILYATGLGETDPPAETGTGGVAIEPFQRVVEAIEVFVGDHPAVVEFAGLAPGLPGVYQLNILVPGGFVSDRIQLVAGGRPGNTTSFTTALPAPVIASRAAVAEDRPIDEFHRIQLFTVGSVAVRVGEPVSLRIEADDNVLPLITTVVRDGALRISATGRYQLRDSQVRIELGTPTLDRVEIYGVGSIAATGVAGERFEVRIAGVGDVEASGAVRSVDTLMAGVGSARLFDLASEETSVWLTGVGSAEVNATRSLFARLFGVGNVVYSGNPAEIDIQVKGFGSIEPR